MKRILIALGIMCCTVGAAQAQVNVNINTGQRWYTPPPRVVASNYYYYPQIQTYYDVNRRVYIYSDGGTWRTVNYFPRQYGSISRYNTQRVVINNVQQPWTRHSYYRQRYVYRQPTRPAVVNHYRYSDRTHYSGYKNHGQWKKENKKWNPGHGKHDRNHGGKHLKH